MGKQNGFSAARGILARGLAFTVFLALSGGSRAALAGSPPSAAQASNVLELNQLSQCAPGSDDDACIHAAVTQLFSDSMTTALDLQGRTLKVKSPIIITNGTSAKGYKKIFDGAFDCASFGGGNAVFDLSPGCSTTTAGFCVSTKYFENIRILGRHQCDGFYLDGGYYDIFLKGITVSNPKRYGINDAYMAANVGHGGHVLHISGSSFTSDGSAVETAISVGSADSLITGNTITGFAAGIDMSSNGPVQLIDNKITMRAAPSSGELEPALQTNVMGVYAGNTLTGGIVRVPVPGNGQVSLGVFTGNKITASLSSSFPGFIELVSAASSSSRPVLRSFTINKNELTNTSSFASPQVISDQTTGASFSTNGRFGGFYLWKNMINGVGATIYPTWKYLTPVSCPNCSANELQYADPNPSRSMPLGCRITHVSQLTWDSSLPQPEWNLAGVDPTGVVTIQFKQVPPQGKQGAFSAYFDCDDKVVGKVGGLAPQGAIWGFACVEGLNQTIPYAVYAGGPAGVGTPILQSDRSTNLDSNWAEGSCGDPATSTVPHAFWIGEAALQGHSGEKIYVYAISPLTGAMVLLPGSGTFAAP